MDDIIKPQQNLTENDLKEYNPIPQISERVLIRGHDRRVVWEKMPEVIMLRIMSSTGESYIGTGTILSSEYHPFCVITAAHNVVQLGQDGPINVLAIGGVMPDGEITNADGWAYFKNYKTKHDASYGNDLAMVFFPGEPKITSRAKIWLSLDNPSESWESQLKSKVKEIMVVGFPGGKNKGKLMGMKGSGAVIKELIEYKDIDTSAGQSGCPVYYFGEKGEIFILGIHYGATSGSNVATILSPRHIKFLQQCFKKSKTVKNSPYVPVIPSDKLVQKIGKKLTHSTSLSPPQTYQKYNMHERFLPENIQELHQQKNIQELQDKSPYIPNYMSTTSTSSKPTTSNSSTSTISNKSPYIPTETHKPKKVRIVHVKGMDQSFILSQEEKHLNFSTRFKQSVTAAKESALSGTVTVPEEGFFYVFSKRQKKFNKITVSIETGSGAKERNTKKSAARLKPEINTTTTTTTITTKDFTSGSEQIDALQQECDQLNKKIKEAVQKENYQLAAELQTALDTKNKRLLLLKNPYLQNTGTIVSGTIVGNTVVANKVMSIEENQDQLDDKIRSLKEACDKLEKKINETDWEGNYQAAGKLQQELNSKKEMLRSVQNKWNLSKKNNMTTDPS